MSNITPFFMAPTNSATEVISAQIGALRGVHPLYEKYRPLWDFYLAAYEGGPDFTNPQEIHRHPREHIDDFNERTKRLHYFNYCEALVDFFTAFIFAETIQRDGGSNADWYNKFIKDVNNKGEDITSFMQQVSDAKQIFGMVYVLVDAPQLPDGILTRAAQDEMNLRPYWVLVRPTEVLDWVVDAFDKFIYLKRVEFIHDFDPALNRKVEIERYYEWFRDKVVITDIQTAPNRKGQLTPKVTNSVSIPNKLGEIPFVTLRFKKSISDKHMGNSFLRDFALNNKEVMNLTSLLQEFLYRQCFNILAIETQDSVPIADQTSGDVGTANVMEFPKGGKAPEYITPSADPAKFIARERETIIQQMYKRAAQDTVNDLYNGGGASGFSKAQSFSTTVPKIATRAETLEKAENKLMALTLKYYNKTWDGKVKYKDRYELTNISDALSQLKQLFTDLQMPSMTLVKEEFKRFVQEFDGKINPDTMATINAEIENMDVKAWQETMKEALVGAPKQLGENPPPSSPEQAAKENAASNDAKQKPPSAKVKRTRKPSTAAELTKESTKK